MFHRFFRGYYQPFIITALFFLAYFTSASQPLRVGIAGLSHDHVNGIMHQFKNSEVIIIGIAEPDAKLAQRYKNTYHLPDSLFYHSLSSMLERIHPDVVLAYNDIAGHLSVVEACAPKGIPVMVEKPLATTVEQAKRMEALVKQYHIKLLTNYETTWYGSNELAWQLINDQHALGNVRKIVFHTGHQGPKEIGCSPDFLAWLTDPIKNGGGALTDFGCYGSNISTWLMGGKAPIAVSCITKHIKPAIYPKVDDDATIVLEYPNATCIIEASWNWPYGIKDMEVFGEKGYLHALNGNNMERRDSNTYYKVDVKPPTYRNNLPYLQDVLRGKIQPVNDLSSLENNLIVVRILDAARRSAKEGRRITL